MTLAPQQPQQNSRFLVEEALGLAKKPRGAVTVILAPMEMSTTYVIGTASGPQEIIHASHQLEDYDLQAGISPNLLYDIDTDRSMVGPMLKANAAGDVETGLRLIRAAVAEALRQGRTPCLLGGEHTVTLGAVQAFREITDKPLTIVQIDAHGDLRAQYEGRAVCHATVMHHASKLYPVHQLGIRVMCDEEKRFLAGNERVRCYPMHELRQRQTKEHPMVLSQSNSPAWMDEVVATIPSERVYLTVDVDGFDPMIMPATGTPVPGGFTWEEGLAFLQRLFLRKQVVGADVVELCPQPGLHAANFLTAMLVYKLIGLGFQRLG